MVLCIIDKFYFKGWIWTIDSYKSFIASGSWDKTISIRDLNADFKNFQTLKFKIL
jgi:hypothetical protein